MDIKNIKIQAEQELKSVRAQKIGESFLRSIWAKNQKLLKFLLP